MKDFNLLLTLVLLLSYSCVAKNTPPLANPELERLDWYIANGDTFVRMREAVIDSLKQELSMVGSEDIAEKYRLQKRLFEECDGFDSRMAMNHALRKIELARQIGDPYLLNEARIDIAASMITQGMTNEAIEILNTYDRSARTDSLDFKYYHRSKDLYNTLAKLANNTPYGIYYDKLVGQYIDSMEMAAAAAGIMSEKIAAVGKRLSFNREYLVAQENMLPMMYKQIESGQEYGGIAYTLATNALAWGHNDDYVKYLAIASISDIEHAVCENSAMHRLAIHCYNTGDYKRAYSYILYALKDAVHCQSTIRTMRISSVLPIIYESHNAIERHAVQLRTWLLISIATMSLFLCLAIFFLYRQMKKTATAKRKITESNYVKDRYIRHFLNMTALYINKLHSYRRTVKRKIQAGQTADLGKNSPVVSESELKDFYDNFDQAFLHIYPDFVDEFNMLLKKEERLAFETNDQLGPELRIVALMRFGITDNQHIASFLGYSINTIYTYRHKLKSKLLSSDTFDEDIAKIGSR